MPKFSFSRVVSLSVEDCAARLLEKGSLYYKLPCCMYLCALILICMLYDVRLWKGGAEADEA